MEVLFSQSLLQIRWIWSNTSSPWRKVRRLVAVAHSDQVSVHAIECSLPMWISSWELCTSYQSVSQQRRTWKFSFLLWLSQKQTFILQAMLVKAALAVFIVEPTRMPVWQPNQLKERGKGRRFCHWIQDQEKSLHPSSTRFRSWTNCSIQISPLYWDTVSLPTWSSWSWFLVNPYTRCFTPERGWHISPFIESQISGIRTLSMFPRKSAVEWLICILETSSTVMWRHKTSWCPTFNLLRMLHLVGEHGHSGPRPDVTILISRWKSATLVSQHKLVARMTLRTLQTSTRKLSMLDAWVPIITWPQRFSERKAIARLPMSIPLAWFSGKWSPEEFHFKTTRHSRWWQKLVLLENCHSHQMYVRCPLKNFCTVP